ncbi:MAG: hypothetical protein E6R03_14915 [Hyphomicrobiaceae bacterium]|nr:MAG: hypothetical protein E6R03_14915 [Hyphomicrobiaceae bacterium]
MNPDALNKVNAWIDAALPMIGAFGLGVVQIKAIYDAFRGGQPADAYPDLSPVELAQLVQSKAQAFVAAVAADREALGWTGDQG